MSLVGWVRSHHFVWRYKILKIHFPTLWRLYEVKVFPGMESFKLHTGVKIQQVVQKEVKTLSGHRVDSKSPCKWGKCHPLILGLASSPSTVDFLISAGFLACWTTFPRLPSHVDNVCMALWNISGNLLYSFLGQSPIFLFLLSVMGFQQSFWILPKECRAESYEPRSLVTVCEISILVLVFYPPDFYTRQ